MTEPGHRVAPVAHKEDGSDQVAWPPRRIVLATANAGKTAELVELLHGRVEVRSRPVEVAEVAEDADTLEGNARLKAIALVDATGMAALADDTGLEVDVLDGAPGVHSARYAGPEADPVRNVAKLLAELGDDSPRTARFRTVLLLRHPDGRELLAAGVVEGTIASEARGDNGFGYDPVFVPADGDGRTFAEMSRSEKQAISHRGRALRALLEMLVDPEA